VLDNVVFGFDTLSLTYRFLHWNHLDIYIHFTHFFLGIPPPQITNLAHRFGSKSLGVLCTEWDEGAKSNKIILSGMAEDEDGETRFKGKFYYADKLVEICKHYGFDGYLLNIEAK
jgi:mannosyl-glycoprotein endo-beta-N-acetylglucosaminidase